MPPAEPGNELERRRRIEQRIEPLLNVAKPDAGPPAAARGRPETSPVVLDLENETVRGTTATHAQLGRRRDARESVANSVLDERLEQEPRNDHTGDFRINFPCDAQPLSEAHLFDREILTEEVHLLLNRRLI